MEEPEKKESVISLIKFNRMQFTEDDLKLILEGINLAADASNDPKWSMQDLKKYLEVKPNIFFIKKEEEKIGIVFLGIDNGHNEIGNFAIFKKYQGKGYGLQALKVIIDYLRKLHPGKDIEIGVAEKNTKAVNLYKKVGFKITKTGEEKSGRFYRMTLDAKTSVSMEGYSETATEISGDYNQWIGEYMYHGSSSKFTTLEPQTRNNRTTSTTKPKIFFTPFKGFAGFFCIDQNDELLSVFGSDYDKESIVVFPKEMPVKDKDGNYDLSQFQQVDTNIAFRHNVKEFKSKFTKRFVGYIHFVKTDKLISSGLQEHVFHGMPEYWYYKSVQVDKVERVEITATFEYDSQLSNKVGVAALESLPDPAIESFNVSGESVDEFASETMQDTVSAKKMYFSTTDGKLPLDDKGNGLFCKNLDDARIDAAMITYQKKMHKNCCCEGYVPGMKHVLLVHTDESHKEEQVFDVNGSVYRVTFKEPVKAKFYASFGYKKCKIPKWYLVDKGSIIDYKIEKEEDVDLQATCRYVEKFEATESFSQENLGSKDDAFVRDIIRPKIRDGILYHGSANKHVPIKAFQLKELRDKKIKTISLTPYKRLASLFCVPFRSIRENEKGQVVFHHAAFKLDEWFEDIPEDDKYKAVQTVHISHNIKELAPTDKVYTGYLHYVDAEDALEDAGRNPINDKGPNEVVCFKSELKPFKVEQIHVRMISRYSPSFAKEVGHDAESCEPEDIASEEFNPKFSETNVEDISMEEGIELLSEFNEGCKAFERWVNQLEASYIYKTTDDKGVKQVCYSVAQENILTDTIKEIFKKIGEFIRWFWSKLVQLWNFFFGRVQRAQRTFKANCDKIKQHKNSNKYFNENAFKAMKAPYGICIDSMFADMIELGGWVPDKIYETIELVYTNYEKDMEKLMDLLKDNNQSNPLYVLFTATGFGGKATNADDAKMTMYDMLVKEYPANGTLGDAEYDQEAVLDYNALMEAINTSYDKISKFIKSKGDISYSAAKRVLDYGDRVDLSQQEANELAKKVQYISASIRLMVEKYNRSYEQILNHVIKLQECYKKCMQ